MPALAPLPMPQRFDPSLYVIDPGASVSIPLHIIPLTGLNPAPQATPGDAGAAPAEGKKGGGYKIGIMLSISAGGGSAAAKMYEFDTGGQGFWLYPTDTLPIPAVTDCTIHIKYTSGMAYRAVPTPATITFAEAAQPLSVTAVVGLIGLVGGPQEFPIFKSFWGDFGAALQGFTNPKSPTPSLLTALAQLPAPYNTGFIVDVGPYPGESAEGDLPPGQLIVGLTPQLRALFPNTVKMTPSTPYAPGPDATPIPAFMENVINGDLMINSAGAIHTANNIGVVFDTGAPSTEVHRGKEVQFRPRQGDQLQLAPSAGSGDYALLAFETGTQAGFDTAGGSKADVLHLANGYINTGLDAFFRYPVMFDLQNGVIGFPATS